MQKNDVKFTSCKQLPHVELRFSHYSEPIFEKHTHDTYSVGIIIQGRTRFFHHGDIDSLTRGDIALINPEEVHACNAQRDSGFSYFMLYVDRRLLRKIACEITGTETIPEFNLPVVRSVPIYKQLMTFCQSMFEVDKLEMESTFFEAISLILLKYCNMDQRTSQLKQPLSRLDKSRDYLMDNLSRNVSLRELSEYIGMSPFYFLRQFHRQFGLPVHRYQLQQRINTAKRLLTAGHSIVTVASDTGFSDQSHFSRKFKAFVGVTPRQYQLAFNEVDL